MKSQLNILLITLAANLEARSIYESLPNAIGFNTKSEARDYVKKCNPNEEQLEDSLTLTQEAVYCDLQNVIIKY